VDPRYRDRVSSDPTSVIAGALATARAAWPGISAGEERFARQLGAHIDAGSAVPALHLTDLYLAAACADGDAAALSAFEAHLGGDVARALAKLRLRDAAADEIKQRIRHKLFVANAGAEPKITGYTGKGPLRAWLRALTVHEALSEYRKQAREDHETDSTLGELAADDDPELAQIRARYAGPFAEAFRESLSRLSARDRNVLRLVYTDGLSVDEVAGVYGVHRVSVSRWLGQTRQALLDGTRALLRDRLRLDDSELASVTRLCLSQLDVSLDRLLST
jgi:RNA polymerase sigma-70 factor, ECF subfamily